MPEHFTRSPQMSNRFLLICGLWLMAATAPALADPTVPKILDVAISGDEGNYTATITGRGFGVTPSDIPCTGCTPDELQLVDVVSQPARLAVNVTSWSDTAITVTGIAAAKRDSLRLAVYNRTLGAVTAWSGSALKQAKGTPVIDSIKTAGDGAKLKLTITGSGFGDAPPGIGKNASTPFFVFTDWNAALPDSDGFPWNAGFCGQNDCNEVLVNLKSWSDGEIVMNGLGNAYGNDWIVNPGDAFCVGIWPSTSTSGGTTGGTFACGRAPK
jgi:hypothetical protein